MASCLGTFAIHPSQLANLPLQKILALYQTWIPYDYQIPKAALGLSDLSIQGPGGLSRCVGKAALLEKANTQACPAWLWLFRWPLVMALPACGAE